jgi:hypothetical protein
VASSNNKNLVLPLPAPTNTVWVATLTSAFVGFDPNGVWELYVNDRGAGDAGNLSSGWQLVLETAPTLTLAPGASPVTILENGTNTVNFTIGDSLNDTSNLVVSVTANDNTVLIPTRNVTFAGPPANSAASGAVVATIVPAALQSGTANLTFTVTRSDGAHASANVVVHVTPINVAPTISRLDTFTMLENSSTNLQFLVHDDDTPLGTLSIKATSDNQVLIPSTSLTFFNSGTNQIFGLPNNNTPQTSLISLNLAPVAFQSRTAHITVQVTDGLPEGTNVVTSTFQLVVSSVIFPRFFITTPGPQTVAAGGTRFSSREC